jgi:biopolymer transport protein ExbD
MVTEDKLKSALRAAAQKSHPALTLVIHADKAVTYDRLIHLALLAREAGIQDALLATLPRVVAASSTP